MKIKHWWVGTIDWVVTDLVHDFALTGGCSHFVSESNANEKAKPWGIRDWIRETKHFVNVLPACLIEWLASRDCNLWLNLPSLKISKVNVTCCKANTVQFHEKHFYYQLKYNLKTWMPFFLSIALVTMKFETCVKLQSQRVQDGEWPLKKKLFAAFADLQKEIKYISRLSGGRRHLTLFQSFVSSSNRLFVCFCLSGSKWSLKQKKPCNVI